MQAFLFPIHILLIILSIKHPTDINSQLEDKINKLVQTLSPRAKFLVILNAILTNAADDSVNTTTTVLQLNAESSFFITLIADLVLLPTP